MSTPRQIRQLARKIVPMPLLAKTWAAYSIRKARTAQEAFKNAGINPPYLDGKALESLQAQYPLERPSYTYDQATLEATGHERINTMLAPLGNEAHDITSFLDMGSWDGTTCALLDEMGKQATGIDIRREGLTAHARNSNAHFEQMDAEALGFAANSFDYVFSFNSFEHFPDPARALGEAWRVVRPGGYIYLNFGPIYFTPKGAHQFRVISVPYCECLFTKEILVEFADANHIELTEFRWMNEWTVSHFRNLWGQFDDRLERLRYFEIYNADHVDMIERYPSCFRSKTAEFDDLIISNMEILFRKRQPG